MIRFEDVFKSFRDGPREKCVADGISAVFPTGRSVALLGRNGAGKSTLLKLVAGTLAPDRGIIRREGTVSFPVGFAGSFHPRLSGRQNTRFVARIYAVDSDALVDFVRDFADLGAQIDAPVGSYSSGMRARLAFGISMGLHFDTYLVDEVTAVGDAAFRRKSSALFRARMARSGAIVVSHSLSQVRDLCDAGAVLEDGRLTQYDDVEDAIRHHAATMQGAA